MRVVLAKYNMTTDLIESDFISIVKLKVANNLRVTHNNLRVIHNRKGFITEDMIKFLNDLGTFISLTGFHNIESEELHALVVDNDLGTSYMTLIRTNVTSKSVEILVDKIMAEYFDLLEYMSVVRIEIKKILDGIG